MEQVLNGTLPLLWKQGRRKACSNMHSPAPSAHRQEKLSSSQNDLMRLHATPPVITTLLNGLRKVWLETLISTSHFTEAWCESIVDSHELIGWWPLICGKWSVNWLHHHSKTYQRIGSQRSPRRWQKAVSCSLLQMADDFWQFQNDMLHAPDQQKSQHMKLSNAEKGKDTSGIWVLPWCLNNHTSENPLKNY